MIIRLTQSKLFTEDPASRFASQYGVSEDIWRELWRRCKLLGYSVPELCEVFYIKVGRPINRRKMEEWIFKGEVFMKVHDAMQKGVESVSSEFFGELEPRVLNELLRNIKYQHYKSSNSVV